MTIDGVLDNFKKIEKALSSSSLVETANENLLKSLTASSLTHEKRSLLIQQFSEQVALNFVNMALDKAMQFDNLVAETNLKVEQKGLVANQKATELKKALDIVAETNLKNKQKDLANISIYEKQASASKQLGVNIYSNGWTNQGGGLIDAQILGFKKDMRFKVLKSLSEQAGMLAQNDVATPSWMTNEMKSSINYMKS